MCCFIIWISFDYFSTWVKQMLMTALFLMYLGEMLNKKCSAQGEWSGQPNIAGSGQSKGAASIRCLAPAPAIMKCEDRAVEGVKIHERARAVGQMRFRFSSLSWLQRWRWNLALWACDQVVILHHRHHPWGVWFQQEKLGTLYCQSSSMSGLFGA